MTISLSLPLGLVSPFGADWTVVWIMVVVIASGAIGLVLQYRLQKRREPAPEVPFLVFPADDLQALPAQPAPATDGFLTPAPRVPRRGALGAVDGTSDTLRISAGFDGQVQLLPGRLEVLRGPQTGREFHFLRVPGQAIPEVTLGRSPGAAHRHIQIPDATVSRLHARLLYEERAWSISNLSTTNPLRVNGRQMDSFEEAVILEDGDVIELGTVELRYRVGRS